MIFDCFSIWPFLEFALTALHFLDYCTYVPPKGSCGIAAYINTIDVQRTLVSILMCSILMLLYILIINKIIKKKYNLLGKI